MAFETAVHRDPAPGGGSYPAAELAALIERFTRQDGEHKTAIDPLVLYRSSFVSEPMHTMYQSTFCLIAQGRKEVRLGDDVYYYDPTQYLIASVSLPVVGQVVEATPSKPYLAIRLDLDLGQIGALMMESVFPDSENRAAERGLFVSDLEAPVLDAVVRLVRLLETPDDIRVVAPLVMREIFYRLLVGREGARLRQIALGSSQTQRIVKVIDWIKRNYSQPFRIEEIAREVYMSPSSLHHQFKAVTAMSPLQYQKQLRLQEARRLMIGEDVDAMTASYLVGDESPSQFSREYRRLFGSPPVRDITQRRNSPSLDTSSP